MHTVADKRSIVPLGNANYPGIPSSAQIIEDAMTVLIDLDGDGNEEILHDRRTGRTLILAPLHAPSIPRTVMKKGATFHHRQTEAGLEVNVRQDADPMTSESRHAISPQMEERAEVVHSAAIIGLCSLGSVCSRMDFGAAGGL